jgi:SAM-dependent methyltransferase
MKLQINYFLFRYLYHTQFSIHKAMMHYKLRPISAGIKGRWLDIGAGYQPYKKYFAGVDELLTTNTERHYKYDYEVTQLEKHTTYWIEDGKMLPIDDKSLNGVACFQVLSLIDKPEEFFREINRVLQPGGKLILSTDFLFPVWSKEDRYRHTAFNLEKLSESNGFKIESIENFGGFGSTMYNLLMSHMRLFPHIWKRKKTLAKTFTLFLYVILLLLLPLISLAGRLIFLLEKNNTSNLDFTFNLLLSATKN